VGTSNSRAVLEAYKQVAEASWPQMHPKMRERSARWRSATEAELSAELADYLAEASTGQWPVRIFWKLGTDFVFGGCNEHFARDAGIPPAELVGMTDFDRRLPWRMQAAKYRTDDQRVFESGEADLDIIERQQSATGGITWVRAGKAPVRAADGTILGILGMYEILDADTGRRLYGEQRIKKTRG
jgi:PAS domain-containing protein